MFSFKSIHMFKISVSAQFKVFNCLFEEKKVLELQVHPSTVLHIFGCIHIIICGDRFKMYLLISILAANLDLVF